MKNKKPKIPGWFVEYNKKYKARRVEPQVYHLSNSKDLDMFSYYSFMLLPEEERKKIYNWDIALARSNSKIRKNAVKQIIELMATYHDHDEPIINAETIKPYLKNFNNMIVCGFHSGFPPCCIKHYIGKWIFACDDHKCSYYSKHFQAIDAKRDRFDIQYIPCPTCLENETFVKTKDCPVVGECYWIT